MVTESCFQFWQSLTSFGAPPPPNRGIKNYQIVKGYTSSGDSVLYNSGFSEFDGNFNPDIGGIYACFAQVQIIGASGPYLRAMIVHNGETSAE